MFIDMTKEEIEKLDDQLVALELVNLADGVVIGQARMALDLLLEAKSQLAEIRAIIGNRSVTGVLKEAAMAINQHKNCLKDVK